MREKPGPGNSRACWIYRKQDPKCPQRLLTFTIQFARITCVEFTFVLQMFYFSITILAREPRYNGCAERIAHSQ